MLLGSHRRFIWLGRFVARLARGDFTKGRKSLAMLVPRLDARNSPLRVYLVPGMTGRIDQVAIERVPVEGLSLLYATAAFFAMSPEMPEIFWEISSMFSMVIVCSISHLGTPR